MKNALEITKLGLVGTLAMVGCLGLAACMAETGAPDIDNEVLGEDDDIEVGEAGQELFLSYGTLIKLCSYDSSAKAHETVDYRSGPVVNVPGYPYGVWESESNGNQSPCSGRFIVDAKGYDWAAQYVTLTVDPDDQFDLAKNPSLCEGVTVKGTFYRKNASTGRFSTIKGVNETGDHVPGSSGYISVPAECKFGDGGYTFGVTQDMLAMFEQDPGTIRLAVEAEVKIGSNTMSVPVQVEVEQLPH